MAELDQENNVETEDNKSEVGIDNLKVLENIEVKLTVEVGSSQLKIRDLLRLNEGSVVELERLAGDPLDILAFGIVPDVRLLALRLDRSAVACLNWI